MSQVLIVIWMRICEEAEGRSKRSGDATEFSVGDTGVFVDSAAALG
jgi:hypothetical protein